VAIAPSWGMEMVNLAHDSDHRADLFIWNFYPKPAFHKDSSSDEDPYFPGKSEGVPLGKV
jgi:hypothetical protein